MPIGVSFRVSFWCFRVVFAVSLVPVGCFGVSLGCNWGVFVGLLGLFVCLEGIPGRGLGGLAGVLGGLWGLVGALWRTWDVPGVVLVRLWGVWCVSGVS